MNSFFPDLIPNDHYGGSEKSDVLDKFRSEFHFLRRTGTIPAMTHRLSVILIMISALILAGCQVSTRPMDVENFSTNRAATQDPAAYDGIYTLYNDDNDQVVGPILMSKHLKQGEIVGFEIDNSHVPFAIAGKDRLQLPAGRYRWQMTADAGQADWKQTNVVVVEVIIATAVVALIVVSTIIAVKGL